MSGSGLVVSGLVVEHKSAGVLVDGVDLAIEPEETRALVGASGSGKTLTSLAIMGLLDPEAFHPSRGRVRFEEVDVLADGGRSVRGARLGMVFQEPATSLNPAFTIGTQIADVVRRHHRGVGKKDALRRAAEWLERVGIASPERRIRDYPHHLSGGQRQRVMIAIALAGDPGLLIADEPTSALDATVQSGILALLEDLKQSRGLAMLFITHDVRLARAVADTASVMDRGRIVESGECSRVFDRPEHAATRALMDAAPALPDV